MFIRSPRTNHYQWRASRTRIITNITCQTNHDKLLEGAGAAANLVLDVLDRQQTNQPGLALCVSCVGRKGVMAEQVVDEVKLVQQILGSQTYIAGFYSHGKIATRPHTSDSVLHNQTMTIGYLS